MGVQWRTWSERFRQKLPQHDKSFVKTSNQRNEKMLKEAGLFHGSLQTVQKKIVSLNVATRELFDTVEGVLAAPLPRIFEADEQGAGATPIDISTSNVGGLYNAAIIPGVQHELPARLQEEVLTPLSAWDVSFDMVKRKMRLLQKLALELDSRRHTVVELNMKVEKLQAQVEKQSASATKILNATRIKLKHKELKCNETHKEFVELEEQTHQQLIDLIEKARWLKTYLVAALRMQIQAFHAALGAIDPRQAREALASADAPTQAPFIEAAHTPMIESPSDSERTALAAAEEDRAYVSQSAEDAPRTPAAPVTTPAPTTGSHAGAPATAPAPASAQAHALRTPALDAYESGKYESPAGSLDHGSNPFESPELPSVKHGEHSLAPATPSPGVPRGGPQSAPVALHENLGGDVAHHDRVGAAEDDGLAGMPAAPRDAGAHVAHAEPIPA